MSNNDLVTIDEELLEAIKMRLARRKYGIAVSSPDTDFEAWATSDMDYLLGLVNDLAHREVVNLHKLDDRLCSLLGAAREASTTLRSIRRQLVDVRKELRSGQTNLQDETTRLELKQTQVRLAELEARFRELPATWQERLGAT